MIIEEVYIVISVLHAGCVNPIPYRDCFKIRSRDVVIGLTHGISGYLDLILMKQRGP